MNKKQAMSQTKNEILTVIRTQKPETVQQLIQKIAETSSISKDEITETLLEVENEDKVHFTKKQMPVPVSQKEYVFSGKAAWYWITIAIAVATTVSVFTIPENAGLLTCVRSVLGILFVLFLPGYAFTRMLFPSKVSILTHNTEIDTVERVVLGTGLSLVLVPIVGLILNYTPWGIRLTPITLSLLALTAVFATVAVLREFQAKALSVKSAPIS